MAKVEKSPERRQHERLQFYDGAFATLILSPPVTGQILNISESGLAFRCIASRDYLKDTSDLNIVFNNGNVGLHNIPVKPIWDHAIPENGCSSLISTRHCAVKFGDLTDKQRSYMKIIFHIYGVSPEETK